MMGLCSIIPAQMLLVGGSCYTGISAKGRKQAMHGARPSWAFAIARGSDHHDLRYPEVSRVFRQLRRAWEGVQLGDTVACTAMTFSH